MKIIAKSGWLKRLLVATCSCVMAIVLASCNLTGVADTIGDLIGGKTGVKKDKLTYQLSDDGTYYTLVDSETGGYIPNILAEIDGIPVTKIGKGVFIRRGMSKIIIPNSVTIIEEEAFGWCCYCFEVIIPNSVEVIKDNAFYGCRALRKVALGENVKSIGDYAFFKCGELQTVE